MGHGSLGLLIPFCAIEVFIVIYMVRHYWFTLDRLFGRQRYPLIDVPLSEWPAVTVLVAAHNEEAVIADVLEALLQVDYPPERLHIVPVNDRSTDGTEAIIDAIAARNPGRITPFHRRGGKARKAAALQEAMENFVQTEIVLLFDADYVPGRPLIRQLVAPFFDPEVGCVMGRVVPMNVSQNLLTRLLDMERGAGYQIDQQARMNMRLVPQFGGTAGGMRKSALFDAGGWNTDTLTEDTDLTFRLMLRGWKTVYQNRAECYEESPVRWPVRIRQNKRWAKGHNQVMWKYSLSLFRPGWLTLRERIDGLLLLWIYAMAPALLIAWLLAVIMFYRGDGLEAQMLVLFVASFTALGNFATFFEIAASARIDGSKERLRILPLHFLGFLVSMMTCSQAAFELVSDAVLGADAKWDKTERSRQAGPRPVPEPALSEPVPSQAQVEAEPEAEAA
jgi:cellulose synthase/poly-beta-1,6-N-acetylglucosamine synthase-like glycosyltransferase